MFSRSAGSGTSSLRHFRGGAGAVAQHCSWTLPPSNPMMTSGRTCPALPVSLHPKSPDSRQRLGQVTVGAAVNRLQTATLDTHLGSSTESGARGFSAAITIDGADLSPALLATLKHAASMANPVFYERQRRRASTWAVPRFLRSYDETITGDLILPCGLLERLRRLVEEAGSHLELVDERSSGDSHVFKFHSDP